MNASAQAGADRLFALLARLGITTRTATHDPAFTVEDGHKVWSGIPGVHCKNLFLKDAKSRLWLVVAPVDRRLDLKALPDRMGSARLSFGSAERLHAALGVLPGSVTPFALINDPDHKVQLVLDAWMMTQPLLNFHPLRNDMTTSIATDDFRTFLTALGRQVQLVTL